MSLSDSVASLMFLIKADGSNAEKELKKVGAALQNEVAGGSKTANAALDKLTSALGGAEGGFSALLNPAALAAAGVAAIGAAAVATGKYLFDLAEQSADFASKIKDVETKTGLTAESVSTLGALAAESNVSMEKLGNGVSFFEKKIASAKEGSKSAIEVMTRLFGKDWQDQVGNADSALDNVFKKIDSIKDPIARAKASSDSFGKQLGGTMLVAIDAAGGSFEKFKKHAEEMGLTLSEKDVKASKDFQKALAELEYQGKVLTAKFTTQYMGQITSAIQNIEQFFASHQEGIKGFGNAVAGVIETLERLVKFAADHPALLRVALASATMGASEAAYNGGVSAEQVGAESSKNQVQTPPASTKPEVDNETYLANLKAQEEAEKAAEKARKEAEKRAEDDLKARISLVKEHQSEVEKIYEESLKKIRETFKATGDSAGFTDAYKKSAQSFISETVKNSNQLDALQKQQSDKENLTANQRLLKDKEVADSKQASLQKVTDATDENEKLITESVKKNTDDRIKKKQEEIKAELDLRKATNDRVAAFNDAEAAAGTISKEAADRNKQGLNALYDNTDKRTDDPTNKNIVFQVQEADETGKLVTRNKELFGGYLAFRYEKLQEELRAVKGNADEETRVIREMNLLKEEAAKTYFEQQKTNNEQATADAKKSADEQIKDQERILRLQKQVLETENDLRSFRKEQERKTLENTVDYSTGKDKFTALESLRKFDIDENQRQQEARDKEAEAQKSLELNEAQKIKDAKTRQDTEAQINQLYKDRIDLSGEQKKADDKNTQNQYDNAVGGAKSGQYGGGQFGGFMGEMAQISDPMVSQAKKQEIALQSLGGAYDLLKQTAGGAVNSMISGGADLLTTWILTGKGSAKAFEQIAASAVANLAVQAGVRAIFEVAEGLAASANFDFYSAALHFSSAKMFGLVSAGAAVAAVGLRAAIGNSNDTSKTATAASSSANSTSNTSNSVSSNSSNDVNTITQSRLQAPYETDNRISRIENALANININVTGNVKADRGLVVSQFTAALDSRDSTLEAAMKNHVPRFQE